MGRTNTGLWVLESRTRRNWHVASHQPQVKVRVRFVSENRPPCKYLFVHLFSICDADRWPIFAPIRNSSPAFQLLGPRRPPRGRFHQRVRPSHFWL